MAGVHEIKILPVMVIEGPDAFTRRGLIEAIRQQFLQDDSFGLVRLEAFSSVATVLDECRTSGMFAAKKLVVLDPADHLFKAGGEDEESAAVTTSTARDLILSYAEKPAAQTVLLLACDGWLKTTRLHKFLEAQGALLSAHAPRPGDLVPWLNRRAWEIYKKKIDGAAAGRLAELVGPDFARLDSELAKLSLYADKHAAISVAMVETMVGFQHEQKVWDFIDALSESQTAEAIQRHAELLEMDARAAFTLVGAVYHWINRIIRAREMLDQRMSDGQIIRELKLFPPPRAAKMLALARRWGLSGAHEASAALLAVDMAAKSSLGDPRRNMETFVVKIAALAQK